LEVVTRGVKVLLKRLLTAKFPITLVAFEDVSWGIQVLLQCMLAAEVSITRLTVLGHFAQRLLWRCRPSWDIEHISLSELLLAGTIIRLFRG